MKLTDEQLSMILGNCFDIPSQLGDISCVACAMIDVTSLSGDQCHSLFNKVYPFTDSVEDAMLKLVELNLL